MSAPDDRPPFDFSKLFADAMTILRVIAVGMTKLVTAAEDQGTFLVFASPASGEMPLQKGVNGVVRQLTNNSTVAAQVQLLDGNETQLFGGPNQQVIIPAGTFVYVFVPFKVSLRAIIGPSGSAAYVAISGEIHN
jgi:hypothetical protein